MDLKTISEIYIYVFYKMNVTVNIFIIISQDVTWGRGVPHSFILIFDNIVTILVPIFKQIFLYNKKRHKAA